MKRKKEEYHFQLFNFMLLHSVHYDYSNFFQYQVRAENIKRIGHFTISTIHYCSSAVDQVVVDHSYP